MSDLQYVVDDFQKQRWLLPCCRASFVSAARRTVFYSDDCLRIKTGERERKRRERERESDIVLLKLDVMDQWTIVV